MVIRLKKKMINIVFSFRLFPNMLFFIFLKGICLLFISCTLCSVIIDFVYFVYENNRVCTHSMQGILLKKTFFTSCMLWIWYVNIVTYLTVDFVHDVCLWKLIVYIFLLCNTLYTICQHTLLFWTTDLVHVILCIFLEGKQILYT